MVSNWLGSRIKKIWLLVPRYIRVTFLAGVSAGLLTHMFMIVNVLPNLDAVPLVAGPTYESRVTGRWLLDLACAISGDFAVPWINGILAIIYISISSCFIVACLKVRNTLSCVLISALLMTIPVVASGFTFLATADAIFLSLLLASFAGWLASRYKYGFLIAVVPVVFSLAIYQVFFGVTLGLLILVPILEILNNQVALKKTLIKGAGFISTFVVSMPLYFFSVWLTTRDVNLVPYMGMDKMGQIPLSQFPSLIGNAYVDVVNFFLRDMYNLHFAVLPVLIAASIACVCALITIVVIRAQIYREPAKIITLVILLLLLPLGCNIIHLMSPQGVNLLMIYPMSLLPVFAIAVMSLVSCSKTVCTNTAAEQDVKASRSRFLVRASCCLITATIALCIFSYWTVSNQAYFKMHLTYEQMYAHSVSLATKIQQVEGYSMDKEVVLVGSFYDRDDYYPTIPKLDLINIRGALNSKDMLSSYSYYRFLRYYLGFPNSVGSMPDDESAFAELVEILRGTPQYPDYGSIIVLHDKIYVNLSPIPD
ncbi:MAG: glucosyltransferase domain-containing protein [Coriobacteriia bacterium]|nr:glucosyltransferase domain-containing protein [Coriobacteriia bacterium]